MRPSKYSTLICVFCAAAAATLHALERDKKPADIERLVRDGSVEALESRIGSDRSPDNLALLARAQINKAAKVRDEKLRHSAFEDVENRFVTWISAIESARSQAAEQRAVGLAQARSELGGMILGKWVGPDLDEIEMYGGRRGDTAKALVLLVKARRAYDAAQKDIDPLLRELAEQRNEAEDRFLELGVFGPLNRLKLDVQFNLGWTHYFLARCDTKNAEARAVALAASERAFRDLVESGQVGETAARCQLGLALALREQDRYDDAARLFETAEKGAGASPLVAQIQYERARGEFAAGKFDAGRKTLEPLVAKGLDELSVEDKPARFYVNLAHLWDAFSHIVEADRLREEAAKTTARENLLRRSARERETGMSKLNALAAKGGPWPGLIGVYVAASIRSDADVKTLTPGELLFSARHLADDKKYRQALARLEEAATRKDLAPALLGEVLFDIGVCRYQLRDERDAAESFERLTQSLPAHTKAPQAAAFAYQLRSTIAEASKTREDYLKFAAALSNLIERFPRHERREEALWWLPVAYQAASEYGQAIEHFGRVPQTSARWEEAQYRNAMCAPLAIEALREKSGGDDWAAQGNRAADELAAYAKAALQRADKSRDPAQTRKWAAAAEVTAAELRATSALAQYKTALSSLADFEQRFPESEQVGRVLAVRIAAHRGLRQFEQAGEVVEQFLTTVTPNQAGSVLAGVARGMQDEVERLENEGRAEDAKRLAGDALPTFDQLAQWAAADESCAAHRPSIAYGRARMLAAAGRYAEGEKMLTELLAAEPRNGMYQRLYARVLMARLAPDAPAERVSAARRAWEALLADPELRTTQPDAYWEARYGWLSLLLREGRSADVSKAISQDEVWFPELGGPAWRPKFLELRRTAGGTAPADASPPGSP